MGKIHRRGDVQHSEPSAPAKTRKLSDELNRLQKATNQLVTTGRFASALGAGKPPEISDKPPTKSAKRTAQAVEDTLPRPAKRQRSQ